MKHNTFYAMVFAGFAAGAVNGFFGAGGGMVLIPLLGLFLPRDDHGLFASSVAVIFPLCIVTLAVAILSGPIPWRASLPWLPGSALGGYFAAKWGKKIPVLWLHRGLGILILYGGVRYLC